MEAFQALNTMLDKSGKPRKQVSRDIGRDPNFIAATLWRKTVPKADTLALIAKGCGYQLQLASDDDIIVIDPPK